MHVIVLQLLAAWVADIYFQLLYAEFYAVQKLPKPKVSKFGISFTKTNGAPNLDCILTHGVLIVGAEVDQFQQFLAKKSSHFWKQTKNCKTTALL